MSDLTPEHEEKLQQLTDEFQVLKSNLKLFWKCTDTPAEHTSGEMKSSAIALKQGWEYWGSHSGLLLFTIIQNLGNPEAWDD